MAVTWHPSEISIVGFCGLPISAATAMVAPVFESPSGRYFVGDPDSVVPPQRFMDRKELEHNREAGHLTLTDFQWPRQPGGVVLYAHSLFLKPSATHYQFSTSELTWDSRAGVYLNYLARTLALSILHRWGRLLIEDASRVLAGSRPTVPEVDRAMDSAERALFCAPPPEHKQLRIDAFAALAATYRVRKLPEERLYREMRLDFDDVTVAEVRRRSEAKAAGVSAYPLEKTGSGLGELPLRGAIDSPKVDLDAVARSQDTALWARLTAELQTELALISRGEHTEGGVVLGAEGLEGSSNRGTAE
jgi:hypothetical protein